MAYLWQIVRDYARLAKNKVSSFIWDESKENETTLQIVKELNEEKQSLEKKAQTLQQQKRDEFETTINNHISSSGSRRGKENVVITIKEDESSSDEYFIDIPISELCTLITKDMETIKHDLHKSFMTKMNLEENGSNTILSGSVFGNNKLYESQADFFDFFLFPLYGIEEDELKDMFAKREPRFISMLSHFGSWSLVRRAKKYSNPNKLLASHFRDFVMFKRRLEVFGVPIKLVITKMSQVVDVKLNGKLISIKCKGKDLGVVNYAIQIGPWIFRWDPVEVIIPQPLGCVDSVMILDLIKSPVESTGKFWKALGKIIWEWNSTYKYNAFQKKRESIVEEKCSNSYGFVKVIIDKLCSTIGELEDPVSLNWFSSDGPISDYLFYLKRWNKSAIKFWKKKAKKDFEKGEKLFQNKIIKRSFNIKHVFSDTCHKELDENCVSILGCQPRQVDWGNEKRYELLTVLRSFDMAYWYNYGDRDDSFSLKTCPLFVVKKRSGFVKRDISKKKKIKETEEGKKKMEDEIETMSDEEKLIMSLFL